jgi:hypothetical protein
VKITGTIILVVGIIVLILFATADLTGIGENLKFFGHVQVEGVIAGAVVAIVGLVMLFKKQKTVPNA